MACSTRSTLSKVGDFCRPNVEHPVDFVASVYGGAKATRSTLSTFDCVEFDIVASVYRPTRLKFSLFFRSFRVSEMATAYRPLHYRLPCKTWDSVYDALTSNWIALRRVHQFISVDRLYFRQTHHVLYTDTVSYGTKWFICTIVWACLYL